MGNAITVAAATYRHRIGRPIVDPKPGMGYAELFLYMMTGENPSPVLANALDILFMLHADHEQNCSTSGTCFDPCVR